MDSEDVIFLLILPMAVIVAGVVVILAALRYRARMLELVHQERVAMIERGLTPPDLNPLNDPHRLQPAGTRSRSFSLGIVVVGLGLAFMTLIGVAAQSPNEAIGIGGAIVILGAAFIVRSLLVTPPAVSPPPAPPGRPPLPPPTIDPSDRT